MLVSLHFNVMGAGLDAVIVAVANLKLFRAMTAHQANPKITSCLFSRHIINGGPQFLQRSKAVSRLVVYAVCDAA